LPKGRESPYGRVPQSLPIFFPLTPSDAKIAPANIVDAVDTGGLLRHASS
jgi:hypothetical protein